MRMFKLLLSCEFVQTFPLFVKSRFGVPRFNIPQDNLMNQEAVLSSWGWKFSSRVPEDKSRAARKPKPNKTQHLLPGLDHLYQNQRIQLTATSNLHLRNSWEREQVASVFWIMTADFCPRGLSDKDRDSNMWIYFSQMHFTLISLLQIQTTIHAGEHVCWQDWKGEASILLQDWYDFSNKKLGYHSSSMTGFFKNVSMTYIHFSSANTVC